MSVEISKKGAVLIVDDTPTNLEVLVDYLTVSGFDIFVATDGESALEQLNHVRPDLILLDVMMPGIDGFETCRRLKKSKETKDIPVIFMTALSDTVDKLKGFDVGAVDYVTKPIQHEEMLARVTTHLTIRTLQRRLEEQNVYLQQEIAERKRAEEALRESNAALSAANRELRQDRALERVRAEVTAMAEAEDLKDVVEEMLKELEAAGVDFDLCVINIVDEEAGARRQYGATKQGWSGQAEMPLEQVSEDFMAIYRGGKPVVRQVDDALAEACLRSREHLGITGEMARPSAVADAPFAYGTLSLQTQKSEGFSEEDVALIGEFARVITLGYARFLDFKAVKTAQQQVIEEMEKELQTAHDMQMSLLPERPIQEAGVEIAGRCVPANQVGGDYFNYFWLGEGKRFLGLGAADVSGKAMEAAVLAMHLSGIFRLEFREDRPPLEVLQVLEEVLQEQLDPASFVTCCLGILDVQKGQIRLANAAHPFPYHYSAATGKLEALQMPSLPLGILLPPGSPGGYAQSEVEMGPGDLLVLYSDGVTDMQNGEGDFYEEGRLEALIRRHADAGAETLVEAVLDDLKRFKGRAPQQDDVTLLVLRAVPGREPPI